MHSQTSDAEEQYKRKQKSKYVVKQHITFTPMFTPKLAYTDNHISILIKNIEMLVTKNILISYTGIYIFQKTVTIK